MNERLAFYKPGPRFFTDETGITMFEFTLGGGDVIGPRPATDADKERYPEALAKADQAVEEPSPVIEQLPADPAELADHKQLRQEQAKAKTKGVKK